MRTIYPPANGQRLSADCADALEPAFAQLVERAEFAGWSTSEVLRGLCVLTWRFAARPVLPAGAEACYGSNEERLSA